ncbi:site-specific integrase [Spirosoma sp. RP8]|uniref:Site-specific integrase n=1 Tax=Spirosoma liriopis TaxID=2937440 RepID=A0ABT0HHW3_9BACT|nr:site-specific integrase [Spirosoma liriopis]MCK8491751.1 site-specific integrase [Spirosoma liriopis]
MASIEIVLRKNQKADGTYPLAIRYTQDRKTFYTYLGHSVRLSDWDEKAHKVKKSYPNATRFNNMLAKAVADYNDKLLERETNNADTSVEAMRSAMIAAKENTFFKQAAIYCDHLRKTGKSNQLSTDQPRINRFREFMKSDNISFSEITAAVLKKFVVHLKHTRNVTDRTAVNHLVVIRTIYNQAITAGVADRKHYPFGKGKITIKFPDSLKIGLSADEVKLLENAELSDAENHARNLWLISFYFAGMRVSDVLRLKWSDFQNDRLYYAMGKNLKGGSLKVPEKALRILEQYPHNNQHDLVFHDLASLPDLSKRYDVQIRIKTRTKSCNERLKHIAKKLGIIKPMTMHIARHTFGNLSGDKIPIQLLQKLYRHTSITTTIGYQGNFIHKDADDALNSVIG